MFLSDKSNRWKGFVFIVAVFLSLTGAANAMENSDQNDGVQTGVPSESASSDVAQANNPLANFTAINVHNYYIGKFTDRDGKDGNQAWLRYAKPLKFKEQLWIFRASLPLNTYPVGASLDHETGLGDLNAFAAYQIDVGNPAVSFGVGPQITVPTATDDALGSEKTSLGLVNILFNSESQKFQYGYLLSWQQSVAGADDRLDVNIAGLQPFLFYQLGNGLHLRSSAVMSYNLETGDYTVPIGFGIGKVFKRKNIIHNIFIEPQISVADNGAGWARWQVFVGFNNQF